jgi:hypothetical protein
MSFLLPAPMDTTNIPDGKTRLSAGSVLMLEKLLDAVNRSPATNGLITARLPVDKLGSDAEARFHVKRERCFVSKDDFDDVVIGREGQFHFGNDLALCLREFEGTVRNFISCA